MSEKRLGVPSVEHKLREDLAAMTAARDHYFAAFVRRATLLSEALPAVEERAKDDESAADRLAELNRGDVDVSVWAQLKDSADQLADLAARITAELETK